VETINRLKGKINRINSVFYNDTIIQNPNSYFLTINTINLLNINPVNLTYDFHGR
jgi:hypothetical protein